MEKYLEIGQKLGLKGEELQTFVADQQAKERDDRKYEREMKAKLLEYEEKERERNHKMEMINKKLALQELSRKIHQMGILLQLLTIMLDPLNCHLFQKNKMTWMLTFYVLKGLPKHRTGKKTIGLLILVHF